MHICFFFINLMQYYIRCSFAICLIIQFGTHSNTFVTYDENAQLQECALILLMYSKICLLLIAYNIIFCIINNVFYILFYFLFISNNYLKLSIMFETLFFNRILYPPIFHKN